MVRDGVEKDDGHARIMRERKKLLAGIGVPEPSPFHVDEFQRLAIEAVTDGEDCLVVAPTGSGKTYIALESIAAHLRVGTRAVYTTPLKALSNTKYNELKKRFEPEYEVGLLTGDRKIDTHAHCVVATTEIYRNELYRGSERYSLVVLDEVHFIADAQRGAVWEESIILTPKSCTLLMLSASISNAEDIAAWLESVRGKPCRIIQEITRSVELRYGFLHPDFGVIPLRNTTGGIFPEVSRYYERSRREGPRHRYASQRSASQRSGSQRSGTQRDGDRRGNGRRGSGQKRNERGRR